MLNRVKYFLIEHSFLKKFSFGNLLKIEIPQPLYKQTPADTNQLNKQKDFLSNFSLNLAILSLKQLLRGVFAIAAPPIMGVGTSVRSIGVPLLDESICQLPFYLLLLATVIHSENSENRNGPSESILSQIVPCLVLIGCRLWLPEKPLLCLCSWRCF